MNIRDSDDKGYFKEEFDFGERISSVNRLDSDQLMDGIHTFFGKLKFSLQKDKSRNPIKPKKTKFMLVICISLID